eukprot:CAMPEP_0175807444 /NCGR_PEP_ID=MMETSP0107_2-20121207/1723_1 /TAXON_ID=195067 ORGANISM="Goniomonas pacifica, Strain CCMP1869" /NCGR_SAMPLE_ID=MMETSP0107_2 /ASSEMBLY_ACC=CAM_ASM_000203 /LENGTH=30 /DNA_ID= /DNA_START= /DNA_END= /DNA_ORIENTATION=
MPLPSSDHKGGQLASEPHVSTSTDKKLCSL